MKFFALALATLSLVACSSGSHEDPRTARIQALHQQLLTQREPLREAVASPYLLAHGRAKEAASQLREYDDLVQQSQANVLAAGQGVSDTAKVGALLISEQNLLNRATTMIASNLAYTAELKKSERFLDSLRQHHSNRIKL